MIFLLSILFLFVTAGFNRRDGPDPARFLPFLDNNRNPQCADDSNLPRMPLSYFVPDDYFDGIPLNERIPPNQKTEPTMVPQCNHQIIQPPALEAYQFETERYISQSGHNIYDGSCWAIAMAILGHDNQAVAYQQSYLLEAKTCQFKSIRGSAPCEGVIVDGECDDPDQTGKCGFCYGKDGDRSLEPDNAWLFRSISDYWAYANTVDLRCPELNLNWIWNDYKPILGENSWSTLIGTLQVATIRYGGITKIPDNDISITLALNFVRSLKQMQIPGLGCVYYSPKNTLENSHSDYGFTFSIENNISLLGGLKAFLRVLMAKNILPDIVSLLKGLINDVEAVIKISYSKQLNYFRQGGRVDKNNVVTWTTGPGSFAVDCQTWVMSVVGPKKVDQWFGNGTAKSIWETTKKLGGYHYRDSDKSVEGLGYSINQNDQAFSGEWTFGAVNMLRIFAQETRDKSYLAESNSLRSNIESKITGSWEIGGQNVKAVKYANKRYFIPFGWFANPIPSLASTAWAVFADAHFNPFYLGGNYTIY